jgi:RNA polymerase sigma-70 factor (ECF subfamily)
LKEYQTTEAIIRGCLLGQEKAREALYKMYFGYALSVALLYCESRDDAIEVVDDSFMKVFSSIKGYDHNRSFKSWLRTIVVNSSLDKYRRNRSRRLLFTEDLPETAAPGGDATDHLAHGDIKAMFRTLPRMHRSVFSLYEIEGYSHKEISKMMKIPESSSRVYLARAKSALKKLLGEIR